jgi:hypothetical protein
MNVIALNRRGIRGQLCASQTRGAAIWLPALAAANALLLFRLGSGLQTVGGLLLFCIVPGQGLIALILPESSRGAFLRRFILGVAASYLISNLLTLAVATLLGAISEWQLILALDAVGFVLLAASCLVRRCEPACESAEQPTTWLYVGILLAVVCATRFIGLGYSQFSYGDETPILSVITRFIEGHGSLLLEHRKGPVEVLTTLGFALFTNGYREFSIRAPFALASVASVVMIYVIGREMFSERTGFIAGLLASVDGIYLAVTRWAQYQGCEVFFLLGAVYCFWRASTRSVVRERIPLMVLGAAFFGLWLLTHFDGISILPVLGLLYLSGVRRVDWSWKREIALLCACAALVAAIAAPYYLPFALSERLSSVRDYIGDARLGLGQGLYSNLQPYILSDSLFRNSIYYVGLMLFTLATAAAAILRAELKRNRFLFAAWLVFAVNLVVSILQPELLQIGAVNLGVLFCLPVTLILFLGRTMDVQSRAVWLWFASVLKLTDSLPKCRTFTGT